jgi:hypothetical protein
MASLLDGHQMFEDLYTKIVLCLYSIGRDGKEWNRKF